MRIASVAKRRLLVGEKNDKPYGIQELSKF